MRPNASTHREAEQRAYAAAHGVMSVQREERRRSGRAMRQDDLVQAHVGGDIRVVVWARDAHDVIAEEARRRPNWIRHGTADRCVLNSGG